MVQRDRLLQDEAPPGARDNSAAEIAILEKKIERLHEDLEAAKAVAQEAREKYTMITKGQSRLRNQLQPLYDALRMVFGELENVPLEEMSAATPGVVGSGLTPALVAWKQKLPARAAEFIDLLSIHKEMTIKQFCAASHCGRDATYAAIAALNKAQLIGKNGGKYSLR